MFGKKKDFFGTQFLRYKNLMDVEKQKQLAEIKQSMVEENIDIKELYLEKQKLFDSLIEQRTILARREVNTAKAQQGDKEKSVDLVKEAILKFIKYDRLDGIDRLRSTLSPNMIQWAEEALANHQNQLQEANEPATEQMPQENGAEEPIPPTAADAPDNS